MQLNDIQTPAFLVDLPTLKANVGAMSDKAHRLKVRLRPHTKTHKTLEGALLQVEGHFGGITVSTLAEAQFYADGGFRDITYAVPIAPQKLEQAAQLAKRLERLNLLVDHPKAVDAMIEFAAKHRVTFSCFLKLDCGYHRAGVDPEDPLAMEMASRLVRSPGIDFQGLLTHAGHSYDCVGEAHIRQVAEQERAVTVAFASKLRDAGLACPQVSVGSTPTMCLTENLEGVTEIRPGNYIFFDRFQHQLGSCRKEQVAVSVLTTVIGAYPNHNTLLLDAGALAMSKDPGHTQPGENADYGQVLDHPHLKLSGLSQEHGKVTSSRPIDFAAFSVGTRLRIVPNHSCVTAALFDNYQVIENGRVVTQWQPVRGWT